MPQQESMLVYYPENELEESIRTLCLLVFFCKSVSRNDIACKEFTASRDQPELKITSRRRSFEQDIVKFRHRTSSAILSEPSQPSKCSEQLSSDYHAVLPAKQSELQAQLRALLPQAHSSQSPGSPLQLSKLQDVTLRLRPCRSQKLRGE